MGFQHRLPSVRRSLGSSRLPRLSQATHLFFSLEEARGKLEAWRQGLQHLPTAWLFGESASGRVRSKSQTKTVCSFGLQMPDLRWLKIAV